jgi:hypothetical protein
MTTLVTVDLDLITPCREGLDLDIKKRETWSVYDKFKTWEKLLRIAMVL